MDKYLRQENAHASTGPQKKTISNFATKEYTCRVLCLDSNEKKPNVIQKASLSPMIMKKLQQLQKVVDTEVTSDSSDCIESELRYFKPIDHRINPRSHGKLPIKIPTRKPVCNSPVTLLSPTGMIKFQSNFLESAFARIPCSTPSTGAKDEERSPQPTSSSTTTPSKSLKRVHSEDCSSDKRNSKKKCSEEYDDKESPTIRSSKETAKKTIT
ncbi:hypothetical protein NQ317_009509 [Molorchus minor]|uniref:Uncharacterized protein n=1 Tax=Molorchus minor TaxID=1323400 RepID=A0ABQ9J533_9CUCU|nr:hypothetical protein NQ317_009509 [Molorchus minor]